MQSRHKYAVFFKAYTWDSFVERQANRCRSCVAGGDFFISLDETNGPIRADFSAQVIRTSSSALLALGYANRSERGALLWWNADYPHYEVLDLYPDYDYFVFQEYDVTLKGSYNDLVSGIASAGVDFAALPIREDKRTWCWTDPHLVTYPFDQLEGCLMSLCVFSKRALTLLARRRLEMSRSAEVSFWPSAEVFLPTEIRAAGYSYVSLSRFTDTTRYDWRPPSLEQEVDRTSGAALFHPVYDRKRFANWAVDRSSGIFDYFDRQSPVLRALSRVPLHYRVLPYITGLWKNVRSSLKHRLVSAARPKP